MQILLPIYKKASNVLKREVGLGRAVVRYLGYSFQVIWNGGKRLVLVVKWKSISRLKQRNISWNILYLDFKFMSEL